MGFGLAADAYDRSRPGYPPEAVAWSRDGTKVYFDRFTDSPRGIFSIPVLGGDEQLVVEEAAGPQPMPDGSLVVARSNADRINQLSVTRWARSNLQYG